MFTTPYQTTPLKDVNITDIKHGIEQELIMNKSSLFPLLDIMGNRPDSILVLNDASSTSNIKLFSCPMMVNTNNGNTTDDQQVVIDCRGLTSKQRDGSIKVLKPHVYQNMLITALLTERWYFDGPNRFASIAKYPTKLFSNWLTSTVARKLNIDEYAQVRANTIFAYFFLCQFENVAPYKAQRYLTEEKAYSYAIKVSYATGLSTVAALDIIQQIPTMQTVHDLDLALKEHGGSERFKHFNPAYLYSLIARTSFHGVHPDLVYACVEYPPILYMMIFIAATEKGYNKSDIGNIAHGHKSNPDLQYFLQVVKNLIKPI